MISIQHETSYNGHNLKHLASPLSKDIMQGTSFRDPSRKSEGVVTSVGRDVPLDAITDTLVGAHPAGKALVVVARVASTGPAGAAKPLMFSAHYDDHQQFATHELVFVTEMATAEVEQL